MNPAEQCFREGDLAQCLALLQAEVRARPADVKPRVFLAQLLMIRGEWARALNQLQVLGEMDPATLPMVRSYEVAIRCEALRAEVFAGKRSPLLLGDPEPWVALLLQALVLLAEGHVDQAAGLRERAFEAAPATAGRMNGTAFEWIADADPRLGPVMEVVLNGKYYWLPFARLAKVVFEAPTDIRDLVWLPAELTFSNGGEAVGMVPVRYPGSEEDPDDAVKLARKTLWQALDETTAIAMGQRVLATDVEEHGLLDVREIELES